MAYPALGDVASSDAVLDRRAASRDLLPSGTLDAWHGVDAPRPAKVFWPETDDEVAVVLAAAAAQRIPIVPYGAGSGVCGAARGIEGSWVIDTKRLDRIGAVDPETWTVEVGAGVNGQHLEEALAAEGYTCGHSPSSIGCSTIGGWAAARGAGQFSSRYGVFEDMLLGVDVVSPATGARCLGLPGPQSPAERGSARELGTILGSEGTLGIITRLRLRVVPLPEQRWLRGYRMPDMASALEVMRQLMQGGLWPAVVRLYDPIDTWVGGRTKAKHADGHGEETAAWWRRWLEAVDGLPGVRARTLALPLSMPSVLQWIGEGLADGVLLIVGWEGRHQVVDALVAAAQPILSAGEDLGASPGERWYASRHAVSYKLMPVFERGGFADTMEIAGRWSVLPRVYEAVRRAIGPDVVVMAHLSHVYPEGGCIYFSFAGRGDHATYRRVWEAAQSAVLASGATVTHHHGVGSLKAPWASQEVGPARAGWRARKEALDPAGILNPGRLFDDAPSPVVVPETELTQADGLQWVDPSASLPEGRAWSWSTLPAPPPGQRCAWQTGWIEVRGHLEGVPCSLGRGPRSAAGPDLRPWLATHAHDARATVALAPTGPRWMGAARIAHPWKCARRLLRADLRPTVLGVVDGVLHVGFMGPAAEALGAIAQAVVPELTPSDWVWVPMASGSLVETHAEDPAAVHATPERIFREAEAPDV